MLAFCCLVFLVLVMDKNAWGGEVQTETKYDLVDLIVAAEEHNPLLRAAQEQANKLGR